MFWFEPDDGLHRIFGFVYFVGFLDFICFDFLCRTQKTLGNVWILLMSLVKIIIFSSFLGFVVKSKNSTEKV